MKETSFLWLGWRRDLWIFLWVDVALFLRSSRFVPYGDTAWVVRSEKERQTDLESMCLRESKHSMCLSSKRMFFSDLMDLMLHDATKGSSLQRCLYVVQLISFRRQCINTSMDAMIARAYAKRNCDTLNIVLIARCLFTCLSQKRPLFSDTQLFNYTWNGHQWSHKCKQSCAIAKDCSHHRERCWSNGCIFKIASLSL